MTMHAVVLVLVFGLFFALADGTGPKGTRVAEDSKDAEPQKSFYDFTVKDIDGDDVQLSKYRGQVCLVVNVASK